MRAGEVLPSLPVEPHNMGYLFQECIPLLKLITSKFAACGAPQVGQVLSNPVQDDKTSQAFGTY